MSEPIKPPYCINCKHFRPSDITTTAKQNEFAQCAANPKPNEMELVDGREAEMFYCSTMRQSTVEGHCGRAGIQFEPAAKGAEA
jgi:hypothetical protein